MFFAILMNVERLYGPTTFNLVERSFRIKYFFVSMDLNAGPFSDQIQLSLVHNRNHQTPNSLPTSKQYSNSHSATLGAHKLHFDKTC